jgi:DNA invertase Pin-like site-specific DNA recombinase
MCAPTRLRPSLQTGALLFLYAARPALGIDTATPTGRLMLNFSASIGQCKREAMLELQREGLAKADVDGTNKE